jgi:hypothetical protein
MKWRYLSILAIIVAAVGLVTPLSRGVAIADYEDNPMMYKVTIENWTSGQPFSPPVLATHHGSLEMFKVGEAASSELEAIAENGDQIPMFNLFSASSGVTDAVDIGAPILPGSATTVTIMGRPGDKLSLATMLICTNDGITGLNRVPLPQKGSMIFLTNGYDAGTEDNSEMSEDIVDPCGVAGPVTGILLRQEIQVEGATLTYPVQ